MDVGERLAALEGRLDGRMRYVDQMFATVQADIADLRRELDYTARHEGEAWENHRREFEASKRFVATTIITSASVIVAAISVLVVLLSQGGTP